MTRQSNAGLPARLVYGWRHSRRHARRRTCGGLADLDPHMQLEIDVHLTDGTQHLFTRDVRDFGQIVNEVLAQAS